MRFLVAFFAVAALYAGRPFPVEETTIAAVHAAFRAKRLSCEGLVQIYLDRIAAYDQQGPALNSLVVVNPRALGEARELDRRYQRSGPAGPLHCVPLLVKDNFETAGLPTSNGALVFSRYIPTRDAFQVARARQAGAVILAKTSMAEWAFSPYETVNSVLPGYTKNPYALDRVTAGSSGGTAAAVAANLGLAGLGTDTGNSIRGPSSHQALVGIRSTMGLTSRAGVFPLVLLADIAGPITRTVEDAAKILAVVAGADPDDAVTAGADEHLPPLQLNAQALRGATVGVLREAYMRESTDPEVVAVFNRALGELRRAGAKVVEVAPIPEFAALRRDSQAGPCMGFAYDLPRFLAARAGQVPVQTLGEILRSNQFHPNVQRRLEMAERGPVNGPESAACRADTAYRERFRGAVLEAMERYQLDAYIYPTWSNPPRRIGDLNTPHGDNSQVFSPTTGFPAINVPIGYTRGNQLPLGMTLLGRPWSEATLINLAYAYEQATHHRRPPASTPPLGKRRR
ncbi:MAG: amidase family protein [Acidobacteria bacterium]|nr:amidase family protein [Acidobacteriota bacterium]